MTTIRCSRCLLATSIAFAFPVAAFGEERIDTALLGHRGVAWVSPLDFSPAIYMARGVGDVDGDGRDDFAVAFLERLHDERPVPWAVFLVYGRPRLSGDVALVPELERTWQVRGREATADRQSHQVFDIAPAGDVEGDGYGDFFLGYAAILITTPATEQVFSFTEGRTSRARRPSKSSSRRTGLPSFVPAIAAIRWSVRTVVPSETSTATDGRTSPLRLHDRALTVPRMRTSPPCRPALHSCCSVFRICRGKWTSREWGRRFRECGSKGSRSTGNRPEMCGERICVHSRRWVTSTAMASRTSPSLPMDRDPFWSLSSSGVANLRPSSGSRKRTGIPSSSRYGAPVA